MFFIIFVFFCFEEFFGHHLLGYNIINNAVLNPLHRIGSRIKGKQYENGPTATVDLVFCMYTNGARMPNRDDRPVFIIVGV